MLTITQPLLFVDTETTHLDLLVARAWEIALIRRDPDGHEDQVHMMIAGVDLTDADPAALAVGRFQDRYGPSSIATWVTEEAAARVIAAMSAPLGGRPSVLVASGAPYDHEVLTRLLRRHGLTPGWDHHPLDLVTFTYATLAGSIVDAAVMPTSSYDLSEAVGADRPSEDERHTALGDALWHRRWWDQLMTGVLQ